MALVAGATRAAGRGIAVELGAAGATVYCTGRTTRAHASELNRPETIEETAELVRQAGGEGIAVQVDHLDPAQVQALVARIEREQGRLDVLVNDVWGADFLIEWNVPVWKHSLEGGLRMLRLAVDTHIITSHFALAAHDQASGRTGGRDDGRHRRVQRQPTTACRCSTISPRPRSFAWPGRRRRSCGLIGCTAVALTPGWLRSEQMLDNYGVSEANWRDAIAKQPHFVITEIAALRRPRGRAPRGEIPEVRALERPVAVERPAREGVRLHRSGRLAARCVALRTRGPGCRQAGRCDRIPVRSPGGVRPLPEKGVRMKPMKAECSIASGRDVDFEPRERLPSDSQHASQQSRLDNL